MINTESFPITVERKLATGEIEKLWIKPGYTTTITVRQVIEP